jgi:hypothetical protein
MIDRIFWSGEPISSVLYKGSKNYISEIVFCFPNDSKVCFGIDCNTDEVIENYIMHGKYKVLINNIFIGNEVYSYRRVYNQRNYFDGFQITIKNLENNSLNMVKFNVIASHFALYKFLRIA